MRTQSKIINGKRITLTSMVEVPNYQECRPFERDEDLLSYRNLVLKEFHYNKRKVAGHRSIKLAMRALWGCPLGCRAAKRPTKLLYDCGILICPHCRQRKIDEMPVEMLGRLRRHDQHGYALLTLKMKPVQPVFPYHDKQGLRASADVIKGLLSVFRRQITRIERIGLRGGVYGIHTSWNDALKTWDVHLHVIVVGTFTETELDVMRAIWNEVSGRSDKHAFHHHRIKHNLWRVLAYITPGIISTFFDRTAPARGVAKMKQAYAESVKHPAAVAEWLDMARPMPGTSRKRENRLMGSFGCLIGSTVRKTVKD
ncbi:MAG: hypothetical protein H0W83_00145 [Planctomycetes bacterium]|nr:hypothetical protein [Planctomycetota bacterium]